MKEADKLTSEYVECEHGPLTSSVATLHSGRGKLQKIFHEDGLHEKVAS
jgi:hypothetical protein